MEPNRILIHRGRKSGLAYEQAAKICEIARRERHTVVVYSEEGKQDLIEAVNYFMCGVWPFGLKIKTIDEVMKEKHHA